jgi:hypothetical protein
MGIPPMHITGPGARVGIIVSFVLLVPALAVLTLTIAELLLGPSIAVAPIGNAALFLGTLGAVAFCVRSFRGEAEAGERPRWRMTEGVIGGIVGAMSFILLALLWSLAHAGATSPIQLSGVVVFGVIAVAFALSTARLTREGALSPR